MNYFLEIGIMAVLLITSGLIAGRYLIPYNSRNKTKSTNSTDTSSNGEIG